MRINSDILNKLIVHFKDDADDIAMIVSAIESFEDYHRAIYKLELTRRLFSCKAIDTDTYRADTVERDRSRTLNHNAVLAQVNYLNRLAAEAGLQPVYEGIVSEDRPYRGEVANAVLDFVQEVILDRA